MLFFERFWQAHRYEKGWNKISWVEKLEPTVMVWLTKQSEQPAFQPSHAATTFAVKTVCNFVAQVYESYFQVMSIFV